MNRLDWIDKLVILALVWLLLGGQVPSFVGPATATTAVVYTFEKDESGVPSPVFVALDKLNRQGVMATVDEVDTTDGTQDVPAQYKVCRPAAKAAGLPALVTLAGDKVKRVVKDPKTEQQVLEAAK